MGKTTEQHPSADNKLLAFFVGETVATNGRSQDNEWLSTILLVLYS
jgi:hypothetical protein